MNSRDSDVLINDIIDAYQISDEEMEDVEDGSEFR